MSVVCVVAVDPGGKAAVLLRIREREQSIINIFSNEREILAMALLLHIN